MPAPEAQPRVLSPIVIGSVGPLSGPLGAVQKAATDAVRVRLKIVNGQGGVNGHRVDYLVADDGFDPARHRARVQDLVETKGVIAFVQSWETAVGAGTVDYITTKHVPVIGSEGGASWFYTNPMYFPQAPHNPVLFEGYSRAAAQVLLPQRQKKIGLFVCVESPDCKSGAVEIEKHARAVGLEPVYRAESSLAAPDYTAECLNAQGAGVEAMLALTAPDAIRRFARSCARQSYRPRWVVHATNYDPPMIQDENLVDSYVTTSSFAWTDGTPKSVEFVSAMQQYLPGVQLLGSHALGWVSAKLFERAARGLSEPPTSAGVLDGLWSLNNEDLGGLTMPLTFRRDQLAPRTACWTLMTIQKERLVALDGGKRMCKS